MIIIRLLAALCGIIIVSSEHVWAMPTGSQADIIMDVRDAAIAGNMDRISQAIVAGVPIDTRFDDGLTMLQLAVLNDRCELVTYLLRHHASIDIFSSAGLGQCERLSALLSRRPELANADVSGITPLHFACKRGQYAAAKILLRYHANPRATSALVGGTSLQLAAARNDVAMLRLLLANGAPVDIVDSRGRSALYDAAENGANAAVKALLDAGAWKVVTNRNKDTPLEAAARNGHTVVVSLLLQSHPDAPAINSAFLAAASGDHSDVLRVLLRGGADIRARTKDGSTALHLAARNDSLHAMDELLKSGCSPHAIDNVGDTPLHKAASAGNLGAVRRLLIAGADINVLNKAGVSPMDAAKSTHHEGIVELFRVWRNSGLGQHQGGGSP